MEEKVIYGLVFVFLAPVAMGYLLATVRRNEQIYNNSPPFIQSIISLTVIITTILTAVVFNEGVKIFGWW